MTIILREAWKAAKAAKGSWTQKSVLVADRHNRDATSDILVDGRATPETVFVDVMHATYLDPLVRTKRSKIRVFADVGLPLP